MGRMARRRRRQRIVTVHVWKQTKDAGGRTWYNWLPGKVGQRVDRTMETGERWFARVTPEQATSRKDRAILMMENMPPSVEWWFERRQSSDDSASIAIGANAFEQKAENEWITWTLKRVNELISTTFDRMCPDVVKKRTKHLTVEWSAAKWTGQVNRPEKSWKNLRRMKDEKSECWFN